MRYVEWDAVFAAGGTLKDMERWEEGGFSVAFKARVVAWYKVHSLVEAHKGAAQNKAAKKK